MREDSFRLSDAVLKRNATLDAESAHYLQRRHQKYLDYGLSLPPCPEQDRLEGIRERLSDISRDYHRNFDGNSSGLWLTRDELKGLPDAGLSRSKEGEAEYEGQLWHTSKRSELITNTESVKNAKIREAVVIAAENRCKDNVPFIVELCILRNKMAALLGYPDYATFQLNNNVAKSPENVEKFLNDLRSMLLS